MFARAPNKTTDNPSPTPPSFAVRNHFFSLTVDLVVVFDLLYLNGKCLIQMPLRSRRRYLTDLISQEQNVLQIVEHTECRSIDDIFTNMETIMRRGGEGIIVKDPESPYVPGYRGNLWLKVKPDYISELGEFIDAVIIGKLFMLSDPDLQVLRMETARVGSTWRRFFVAFVTTLRIKTSGCRCVRSAPASRWRK